MDSLGLVGEVIAFPSLKETEQKAIRENIVGAMKADIQALADKWTKHPQYNEFGDTLFHDLMRHSLLIANNSNIDTHAWLSNLAEQQRNNGEQI